MSALATVRIHPSQFPERVRQDLIDSLRQRRIQHKFHYDSVKQTQLWLALHEAHSPARTDPHCTEIYDAAFAAAAERWAAPVISLIGLGCGGGQKDARLAQLLGERARHVVYFPLDSSVPMVLVASQEIQRALGDLECHPVVGDLAKMSDLAEVLATIVPTGAERLITFFGMIPNFEPEVILPRLSAAIGPGDGLLFSANLLPGRNNESGLLRILPQYDNELTRRWLLTFLSDLGVEDQDGELRFSAVDAPGAVRLKRIEANFRFRRARRFQVGAEQFSFTPGDTIRIFFSYRYRPAQLQQLLKENGLIVRSQWITPSAEEGVFLCEPSPLLK